MTTLLTKVEECLEVAPEVCTEWEIDFLESVEVQMEDGRSMSDKQEELIDRIYKKVCQSPY